MASKDWYLSFLNRHDKLTLRSPQFTSINRIKAFTQVNVNRFFTNLEEIYAKYPDLVSKTFQIWNMDESSLPSVPTKPVKVVAEKGSRNGFRQFSSAERGTNTTVVLAISVTGQHIPPFYIYNRQKFQRSSYLRGTAMFFFFYWFIHSIFHSFHFIYLHLDTFLVPMPSQMAQAG